MTRTRGFVAVAVTKAVAVALPESVNGAGKTALLRRLRARRACGAKICCSRFAVRGSLFAVSRSSARRSSSGKREPDRRQRGAVARDSADTDRHSVQFQQIRDDRCVGALRQRTRAVPWHCRPDPLKQVIRRPPGPLETEIRVREHTRRVTRQTGGAEPLLADIQLSRSSSSCRVARRSRRLRDRQLRDPDQEQRRDGRAESVCMH